MAPGDRVPHRPLTVRGITWTADQQVESAVEPLQERWQRQDRDPGRGQLDGQWHSVNPIADRIDDRLRVGGFHKCGIA